MEWTQRLTLELENKDLTGDFVTLTFDDAKITDQPLAAVYLDKSFVQNFMKRLRSSEEGTPYEKKRKYYCVGEYGGQFGRPHYHGILIRPKIGPIQRYNEKEYYEKFWPFGSVDAGSVTSQSIAYVCGYLTKGDTIPTDVQQAIANGLKEAKPFSIMSQGIGKEWLKDKTLEEVQREGSVPRYWRTHTTFAVPAEERKLWSERPTQRDLDARKALAIAKRRLNLERKGKA